MAISSDEQGGFSSINVTPLTDVMLVLLITFLLTASSFEEQAIDVPLPRVVDISEVEKDTAPLMVDLAGQIHWPKSMDSAVEPAAGFREFKKISEHEVLALAVHREMPYKKLYPLLVAANEGGWLRIVLLTEARP